MNQDQQNARVAEDGRTTEKVPITVEQVAALDTLIKEVAEDSGEGASHSSVVYSSISELPI
jgi:hypothetical protein